MKNQLLKIKKLINKEKIDVNEINNIIDICLKTKNEISKPQLFKPNEINKIGKYWGLKFGTWNKVIVTKLPNGGTGSMKYAPVSKNDRYANLALSNCELYYGTVKSWNNTKPDISQKKLIEAGASKYWFDYLNKRVTRVELNL